jgi:hypothetical protein
MEVEGAILLVRAAVVALRAMSLRIVKEVEGSNGKKGTGGGRIN